MLVSRLFTMVNYRWIVPLLEATRLEGLNMGTSGNIVLKFKAGMNRQSVSKYFRTMNSLKSITLNPGGIRSHDPQLKSLRWQAETMPLGHSAMPGHESNNYWQNFIFEIHMDKGLGLHTAKKIIVSWKSFVADLFISVKNGQRWLVKSNPGGENGLGRLKG
jgi:hypothetical protein